MELTYERDREGLVRAIDDEIEAVRNDRSRGHLLFEGQVVTQRAGSWLYVFRAEDELRTPGSTPGRLRYDGQELDVVVLATEGFDVYLTVSNKLGGELERAVLSIDLTFLLEELKERLNDGRFWNKEILKALFRSQPEWDLRIGQAEAVRQAASKEAIFLWGPPGTGKTTTLAKIVANLVKTDRRVLVLSHTNVAVDAAVAKVAELFKDTTLLREGGIVRVGVPIVESVREHPWISPVRLAERRHPELAERRAVLGRERKRLDGAIRALEKRGRGKSQECLGLRSELVELKRELQALYERLRAAEDEIVSAAVVAGATLSKAVVSFELLSGRDTVIVDEASMAYIPQIVFACGLATRSVVVVGDFRQLPPVSMATTRPAKKWLQRDIFDLAGIIQRVDDRGGDARLVALREQFRMHPMIAGICNYIAYGQFLRDGGQVGRDRDRFLTLLKLATGRPMVFVDTGTAGTWALKNRQHSRFNGLSAATTAAVAATQLEELKPDETIAIITPYAAQAHSIRRLLSDWELEDRIKVSTVHQFQGHERDVILLDLTDTLPQRHPSKMLSGIHGSLAMRLLNVAVSRARARLIVVGDGEFLLERTSTNSCLGKMVAYLREKAVVLSARDALDLQRQMKVFEGRSSAVDDINARLTNSGSVRMSISLPQHEASFEELATRAAHSGIRTWIVGDTEPFAHKLEDVPSVTLQPNEHVLVEMVSVDNITWLFPLVGREGPCLCVRGPRFAAGLWAEFGLDRRRKERAESKPKKVQGLVLADSGVCPSCGQNRSLCSTKDLGSVFWSCACTVCSRPDASELNQLFLQRGLRCSRCQGEARVKEGKPGAYFGICARYPTCQGLMSVREMLTRLELV